MRRVFILGGEPGLEPALQRALGSAARVRTVASSGEADQLLEAGGELVLVVAGKSDLERRRWAQTPEAVLYDGDLDRCVRTIRRLSGEIRGPAVEALLLAVTRDLGASLGDGCEVKPCGFPAALPEREIALLSIAGPVEGGVVVMPEGELVTRLSSSALSGCAWDREIASTSTLLLLAEEIRGAAGRFLAGHGEFQVATPVVIFGEGLNLRAGSCAQFAFRMDLSGASQRGQAAALVVAGWLGSGVLKATTTAERLAGFDELRHQLLARRGAG